MIVSRADAVLKALEEINRLDSREELVRVELTPMTDTWLWALETRRVYGPGVLGPHRGDLRLDAMRALIEGRDSWHVDAFGLGDLDAPLRQSDRPPPEPPTGEALAAAWQPAVEAARPTSDDDDDEEPERPAIIGATPEEVRQRIDAARAAAAASDTGSLDDLPF